MLQQPGPLYCNVTHAGPITTLDLALANAQRLMRLGDLPCDRNQGCARVACVDNSAVLVCNDTPARVRPAYSLVVAYALRIMDMREDGGCTFCMYGRSFFFFSSSPPLLLLFSSPDPAWN